MRGSIAIVLLAGCSTSFSPKPCAVDTDCGAGLVCEMVDKSPVCVDASSSPITVGESAPISGINQALGTQMKLGIELAFDEQNQAGGIRGRQLVLNFRDDAYDPPAAEAAARAFTDVQVMDNEQPKCPSTALPEPTDGGTTPISTTALDRGPNAVIAELGTVGTPTMLRAAPVALETHTLYFGPFTGASKILRDSTAGDCAKYVFNYRASYAQEAQATVDMFRAKGVNGWQYLVSFDQQDSYGDAGYKGLTDAYNADFPSSPVPSGQAIARFQYVRNNLNSATAAESAAETYLANLLSAHPSGQVVVGIMMTDVYSTGSDFIQAIRTWQNANDTQQTDLQKATRLQLYFSHVSFVGPNALADDLANKFYTPPGGSATPMATDVYVSQVVPNYQSDTSDIVTAYNRAVAANGATPGFTSLEGYIVAKVFVAGLLAHKGPFDPDALVTTFENLPDLSLGIGATAGFTPTNHQYSQSVWGTEINSDGTFKNIYYWTPSNGISFF